MEALRISMVQMNSRADPADNFRGLDQFFTTLAPCDLVTLPEVCLFRSSIAAYGAVTPTLFDELHHGLAERARAHRVWLLAGSLPEVDAGALYNTSVLFNDQGKEITRYRKIHLFAADLAAGATSLNEADAFAPGTEPVMVDIMGWKAGLAICYDLRFPELFRLYADQEADLLLVPSDFTRETGQAHWETLCRARAIENQCFLVAPNQCGVNLESGIESYGHSLAVGPWGERLVEGAEQPAVFSATLEPERLREARSRIPVWQHRRL